MNGIKMLQLQQRLKKVQKMYEDNFKKMEKSDDIKLREKEDELDKLEIHLQKELGIYVKDPCPLSNKSTTCYNCTGYFKKLKGAKTPKGEERINYYMAEKGKKCQYKMEELCISRLLAR